MGFNRRGTRAGGMTSKESRFQFCGEKRSILSSEGGEKSGRNITSNTQVFLIGGWNDPSGVYCPCRSYSANV